MTAHFLSEAFFVVEEKSLSPKAEDSFLVKMVSCLPFFLYVHLCT